MILIEIAAQGVRGVSPAGGRASLRPGYNVVTADGQALRRLLEALFYPGPRDAELVPHASQTPGGAGVRVGATLAGNDGVTYRLVRDLGGAAQLHRFDAERRAFALVSQTLPEIGKFLAATVGVPPRARFGAMLALSSGDLPSRQPGQGLRAGGPSPGPRQPLGPDAARRKLAELRAELARSQSADKLQYQLDGLQSRLFKLEEVIRAGEKIREGLAGAEVALVELQPLAKVADGLGDLDARVAAFEKAAARRDEAMRKLGDERGGVEETAASAVPFWRRLEFWGGVGAGAAAVVAALAGTAAGSTGLRYAALLDVPAFGYAGWVALRWVGELEGTEKAGRRLQRAGDRERKIQEQYERDTAEVKEVMKALGLATIPDLKEALGRLADARAVADEWRGRLAEFESSPEQVRASEERQRVQRDIGAIEARLAGEAGGFVRDPRQVEQEIARVEAEQAAPPPVAVMVTPAPSRAPAGEPLKVLLDQASAELKASPAGVLRIVQPRVSQLLPALSAQRLAGCLGDDRGNLLVQASGRTSPLASLPPADRDLVFLSVKVGIIEQALSGGRAVAFAEDAFAGLPEQSRRVVARLLKQMARSGQVVHATSDPVFREAADHAV